MSSSDEPRPPGGPYLPLGVAVVAFSFSAVLTDLATAGVFVIGLWRLALPAAAGAPFVWRGRLLRGLGAKRLALTGASGALLALHFALWIASLALTTVASSVVLVATNPLFLLVYEAARGRRVPLPAVAGAVAAAAGIGLMGLADAGAGQGRLLGDALALGAALAQAGYFLVGRRLRQEIRVLPYTTAVYAFASVLLLLAAVASGETVVAIGWRNWAILALLAAGPTTLGHTLSNLALRWLDASTVTMVGLMEAIGASLLAWAVFAQVPSPLAAAGGALALAGLAVYLRKEGEGRRSL